MIPVPDMKNVGDPHEKLSTCGRTSKEADGLRSCHGSRTRTPLRASGVHRSTSRVTNERTPNRCQGQTTGNAMEDTGPVAELRQRAEGVAAVLGVNVFQIRDQLMLQRVAVEVAERFSLLEEWYNAQLRERCDYLEHCVLRLVGAANSQNAQLPSEKYPTPTAIRQRQGLTSRATGLSRPSLSFDSRSSSNNHDDSMRTHAAAACSPMKARHSKYSAGSCTKYMGRPTTSLFALHFQSPVHDVNMYNVAESSRGLCSNRRRMRDVLGSCGASGVMKTKAGSRERRKTQSAASSHGPLSRGCSEVEMCDALDSCSKLASRRANHGSAVLLSASGRKYTPRRVIPSSSRLVRAVDVCARD
uniref:Uncharacterized protein n=1 Tax=Trypanosoma congolense (strain IL3000) TaxID=1068625 RepID=G0UQE8_TRYCI|nr:conserved hypothetical protein [Trypanosoma congolense IL3000]